MEEDYVSTAANKPSDGTGKVLGGGQITANEEAESLNETKKNSSGHKLKEEVTCKDDSNYKTGLHHYHQAQIHRRMSLTSIVAVKSPTSSSVSPIRRTIDLGHGSDLIYIQRFLPFQQSWTFFDYLDKHIPWTRPAIRVFGRSCLQINRFTKRFLVADSTACCSIGTKVPSTMFLGMQMMKRFMVQLPKLLLFRLLELFVSLKLVLYRRRKGMKEDRISQLPDDLICQILSHLPIEDAVRTSVLSTRWTNLWLWLPRLKLSFVGVRKSAPLSLANRFFDSNRVSCIDKLELIVTDVYSDIVDGASYLTSWIDAAVKRRIQHLDVKCHVYNIYRYKIPLSLYICDTLVSLKLDMVAWASAEFVSFPCLKTMHLHNNKFPNKAALEALVSCCPILEELEITGFDVFPNVHRVQSQSLKRLTIRRFLLTIEFDYVPELVIDAPLLCGLKIFYLAANIIITNTLESIAKLDINLSFGLEGSDEESVSSKRSRIRSFLSKISRVMDMTISADTFKVIHQYSKLEPLPQFGYMSRLCLDSLHASELKWLTTTFLESCPNLKSLVLAPWNYENDLRSEEINQISFSSVPKCLLSSLESVHFKFTYLAEGYAVVFKLVKYFLENSVVLKKLNLHLLYHPRRDDIFEEILRLPRGSTECEVVVL